MYFLIKLFIIFFIMSCPEGTIENETTCSYDRGEGTRATCDNGLVQKDKDCYAEPPEGNEWTSADGILYGKICPSGTNDDGTNCIYDRGSGTDYVCSPTQDKKGVDCYKKPPDGYDWTTAGGLLYGKVCPSGTNDSGTTCWYDRGVGTPYICPSNQDKKGVDCYEKPPDGYDWTTAGGLLYGKVCPSGTNDSGTTCWYDRGVGTPYICPSDQDKKGVDCYQKPPDGYEWTTPGG